jgi:hypothetical protein
MLQRAIDRVTLIFLGPGPTPLADPGRMVKSLIPPEALQLALEYARAAVAAEVVNATDER